MLNALGWQWCLMDDEVIARPRLFLLNNIFCGIRRRQLIYPKVKFQKMTLLDITMMLIHYRILIHIFPSQTPGNWQLVDTWVTLPLTFLHFLHASLILYLPTSHPAPQSIHPHQGHHPSLHPHATPGAAFSSSSSSRQVFTQRIKVWANVSFAETQLPFKTKKRFRRQSWNAKVIVFLEESKQSRKKRESCLTYSNLCIWW